MREQLAQIKKSVLFIGKQISENEFVTIGTGFLIRVHNIFHLVTAKHVIYDAASEQPTQNLIAIYNNNEGGRRLKDLEKIREKDKIRWIFHDDDSVDLAVIPFPIDVKNDDVRVIPEELFLDSGSLEELYDVFYISYQPGAQSGEGKIEPIIRKGAISRIGNDGHFLIDGAAFPGNSGSPVFLTPSPIRFQETGIVFSGKDEIGDKFIGIIGSYLPYEDIAISRQTGMPRVVFQENTGLSQVLAADLLEEIVQQENFVAQAKGLKGK